MRDAPADQGRRLADVARGQFNRAAPGPRGELNLTPQAFELLAYLVEQRPRALNGRTREASLWIDHKSVSRRHALIHVEGDVARIENCGSKNGTFVNEVRIGGPTPLSDGDAIRLGRAELSFRAFIGEEGTESAREP